MAGRERSGGRWVVAGALVAASVLGGAGVIEGAVAPTASVASRPAPVHVVIEKELMITDLSVVEDRLRTEWPVVVTPQPAPAPVARASGGTTSRLSVSGSVSAAPATLSAAAALPATSPSQAAWTFGRLMEHLSGPLSDTSDFVLAWLAHWESAQTVNGFVSPARPAIRTLITNPWLAASGGTGRLDMRKAPFRLLAIVNRMDLRRNPVYGAGNAGEGRFVFGALDANGNELPFTVIFEYKLPAQTLTDVKRWADRWHALGSLPFGETYNQALEAITADFAGPSTVSLGQLRTNEIALAGPWELREFVIDPRKSLPRRLMQTTVKQNPDARFSTDPGLGALIDQNEAAVLAGRWQVPDRFLGAAAPVSFLWNPPVSNPDARHAFALETCSGCHERETGTRFTHIDTRRAGQPATLSLFLTGGTITDPFGTPRTFDDLERRRADLVGVLTARWIDLAIEVPSTATH